jgi:uncharacterized protein (TIGR02996 family)
MAKGKSDGKGKRKAGADALTHLAAAASSSGADRLRALAAAWRIKPATALAEAIIASSAELDRPRPRITGPSKSDRKKAWLKLAAGADDADKGWLLAQHFLEDGFRTPEHPATLADWDNDPRLTDAILERMGPKHAIIGWWNYVWQIFWSSHDPRAIPALQQWVKRARAHEAGYVADGSVEAGEETLAHLIAEFPDGAPELTAEEARLVASAQPVKPAVDENALLAAVWAAPDDDGPRLVYADYLQERGDPRGEFIALACKPKPSSDEKKRIRQLENEHGPNWFGPLQPAVLTRKTFNFERGFLSLCSIPVLVGTGSVNRMDTAGEREMATLFAHPAWATLREVRMQKLGARTRAPLIAHLKRLGINVVLK